jgi:hypothetical protein
VSGTPPVHTSYLKWGVLLTVLLVAGYAAFASLRVAKVPDFSGVYLIGDQRRIPDPDGSPATTLSANTSGRRVLPFQPWAARKDSENRQTEAAHPLQSLDPKLRCLPMGVPDVMWQPFPLQIVQTQDQITMLFEADHQIRFIYLHRPHPEKLRKSWMGDSIGHWEGDTLVVDTSGENAYTILLEPEHTFHSESLRTLERFKLTEQGTILDYRVTITDPKVFTRSWEMHETYRRRSDLRLMDYVCAENNRDVPVEETPTQPVSTH